MGAKHSLRQKPMDLDFDDESKDGNMCRAPILYTCDACKNPIEDTNNRFYCVHCDEDAGMCPGLCSPS